MLILEQILARKREERAAAGRRRPRTSLMRLAARQAPPRDFRAAIRRPTVPIRPPPRLIAEVKRASPSRGVLAAELDPARLAAEYERWGAAAVSVVTEAHYFQGSLEDLGVARGAIRLPVLRKDFVVDAHQVFESRAAGADAVLLIASAFGPAAGVERLPGDLLGRLVEDVRSAGMTPLVEVHDIEDLERAIDAGADSIGINNRDLKTFGVDLRVTIELATRIPEGKIVVAESGFHTRQDVAKVEGLRVDALLVGEALVTSGDVGAKMRELVGEEGA